MRIIDLTHPLGNSTPVFPGDSPTVLKERVDQKNSIVHFHLSSGMHVGTHMDGPLHMIPKGRRLSEIEVDKFIAQGHVIDARGCKEIGIALLKQLHIAPDDCVLIYTGFDKKFGESSFYKDYPVLTEDFARKLVELKVKFVGMDTPSPDKAPYPVHRILLEKEVLIIEGLNNLSTLLSLDKFEIIALPAKFAAEAAPVRVVARIG